MAISVWQISLALCVLLVPLTEAIACPDTCEKCTRNKIICPEFMVERERRLGKWNLDVRCTSAYNFSDTAPMSMIDLLPFERLTFANCPIPANRSLADTLAMLGPLSNLKELFFVMNSIYNTSAPFEPILFAGLSGLKNISLKSATQHPIVASDLFLHLPQLEWFDLRQYDGDSLPAELLRPLKALKTVELRQNPKLKQLPPGWLNDLPELTEVILFGNGLTSLERFRGTPKLTVVDLSGNELEQLPADMFTDVPGLIALDLKRNQLQTMPEQIFTGLTQLTTLDLSLNKLAELPSALLKDQYSLVTLKLSYNNLTSIYGNVLENMPLLKILHLDHNRLQVIDYNAFDQQTELIELLLNHNDISFLYEDTDVFYLNGKANYALTPVVPTPFRKLQKLGTLNLSHNAIVKLFDDFQLFMRNLSKLDLSYNRITELEYEQLSFLGNITVLNLSGNRIRTVRLTDTPPKKLPQKIILDNNPLQCDCQVHAFVKLVQENMNGAASFAVDRLACEEPAALHRTPVKAVSPMALVCRNNTYDCPPMCDCHIRPEDRAVIVDCSGRNLTTMPALKSAQTINYRIVDLLLQDNQLETLPESFAFLENTDNTTWSAWSEINRLNVSNNQLSVLSTNNLPPELEMLDVSGNKLAQIDGELSRWLRNLRSVRLAGNPWMCECSAELLGFVRGNLSRIEDYESMQCGDNEQKITANLQNELCDKQWQLIAWTCFGLAAFFIVVALCLFLYYRYQHEVKVWMFTHNLFQWLTSEEELDRDKLYDAFVSYSHKDEEFITEHLVPTLERAPMNFRVCWHVRDFMPGEMISTQIMKAVEESRRTIIVLSANYLESVWGQMEFKTAYLQSIEDKRNRVIAIVYDDIGNIDDLDQELRAYLKTNTYVRWGDPWFWDKLRYAMPHPRRVKGMQITSNMRIATMDKLKLIKPTQNGNAKLGGEDVTPTQESTPPIEQMAKGDESPLDKMYEPATPVFTISNVKLDLHVPE